MFEDFHLTTTELFMAFIAQETVLMVALAVIIAMLIYSYVGEKFQGFDNVTATAAIRLINDDALVLDVRNTAEVQSGYINGSRHIALGELNSRLPSLESYKNKPVLAVCASGARSGSACQTLKKAGFTQLYNLAGGMASWRDAKLPITTKQDRKANKKKKKK